MKYLKLWKQLNEFGSKMKLWEGTDLLSLLTIDRQVRQRVPSLEALYMWPYCGGRFNKMYAWHREYKMPFHFIPSCSRFKAVLSPYDWLMAIFGKAIRGKGSSMEMRNWRSGPANRYLFSMFLALRKYRKAGEGKRYWNLGWILMRNHAYQVSAFNYVHHNWHRNMSMREVNKILSQVKVLAEKRATTIDFKRVYIPKPNSEKVRPLGVPTKAWRVYLHMLNNLIVFARTDREGSQHAYLPQRGVHTAWREVFSYLNYKHIYEFDLKGFFDNVNLENLYKILYSQYNFPKKEAAFFRALNRSIVKLTKKDKMIEPDRKLKYTSDLKPSVNLSKEEVKKWNLESLCYLDAEMIDRLHEEGVLYIGKTVSGEGWKEIGVPQGAATSCGLSTLAISNLTEKSQFESLLPNVKAEVVMYADDGIIFLDDDKDLESVLLLFKSSGVEVNLEKSRWVKRDGKWLNVLKFCGIVYDGINERIKASTRKGATLEFGLREQFLSFLLNKREELWLSGSASHLNSLASVRGVSVRSWVISELKEFVHLSVPQALLFQGEFSGYFLSSLFCDSWNQQRPSDDSLTCQNKFSWVRAHWPRYRMNCLKQDRINLLESRLKDVLEKIKYHPDIVEKPWFYNGSVVKLLSKMFNWSSMFPIDYSVGPSGLIKPLSKAATYATMCSESLVKQIKELKRWNIKLSRLLLELRNIQGAIKYYSREWNGSLDDEIAIKYGELLGSCLKIDIYNASSFACASLLSEYPYQQSKIRYRYRLSEEGVVKVENLKVLSWKELYPKLLRRLIIMTKRSFRNNFL